VASYYRALLAGSAIRQSHLEGMIVWDRIRCAANRKVVVLTAAPRRAGVAA
jgi:hypothetical protein